MYSYVEVQEGIQQLAPPAIIEVGREGRKGRDQGLCGLADENNEKTTKPQSWVLPSEPNGLPQNSLAPKKCERE